MMRWLLSHTIWARGRFKPSNEMRNFKRIWLPAYEGFALLQGIIAIMFGSRLLDRLYGDLTDVLGLGYIAVAVACLVGLAFPRLWAMELVALFLLMGAIVTYIAGVAVSPSPEQLAAREAPNYFVMAMLAGLLPMIWTEIDSLISDWVARRGDRRRHAALTREGWI